MYQDASTMSIGGIMHIEKFTDLNTKLHEASTYESINDLVWLIEREIEYQKLDTKCLEKFIVKAKLKLDAIDH